MSARAMGSLANGTADKAGEFGATGEADKLGFAGGASGVAVEAPLDQPDGGEGRSTTGIGVSATAGYSLGNGSTDGRSTAGIGVPAIGERPSSVIVGIDRFGAGRESEGASALATAASGATAARVNVARASRLAEAGSTPRARIDTLSVLAGLETGCCGKLPS
jgi:hypothetical protein